MFTWIATLVISLSLIVPAAAQTAKKPVTSESDLPQYSYAITGSASQLVQADDATFDRFALAVGADVDKTLAGYDVRDRATLAGLLLTKFDVLVFTGKTQAALDLLPQIRALQDKPDAKLTTALSAEAALRASLATGATSGPAFDAAFRTSYAAAIGTLPYDVVGNALREAKGSAEIVRPALVIGQVQANIDPAVAKAHAVSGGFAATMIRARFFLTRLAPAEPSVVAVLDGYLKAHDVARKPDVFAPRDVSLAGRTDLTPVPVAIWDSGSDISLFPGQVDDAPAPPGADPHDLAFDLLGFPAHGNLYPLSPEQTQTYPQMIDLIKGFQDLTANVDSPEATGVRTRIASLKQSEVGPFLENLEFYSNYVHGTHVAGIAVRGNPAARIVVGRLTYDWKNVPTPPTEETVRRGDEDYQKYVDYFKTLGVRVVNMSWGGTPEDYESALEKNGIGKTAAERKALAQHYFGLDKAALTKAIASAPGILFICAAGNSNADASFEEDIPASIRLPNLLGVGAVDQAGDATSFTSYGPTVRVDADGYNVVSTFPGGRTVPLSGTSMASPNVVNLAAKLLALDPKLTPTQTIDAIVRGATPSADGRRNLIDPAASVKLLATEKPGT